MPSTHCQSQTILALTTFLVWNQLTNHEHKSRHEINTFPIIDNPFIHCISDMESNFNKEQNRKPQITIAELTKQKQLDP